MTIDEEIKRFFLEYEIRQRIMPFNTLPEHLQKIQHNVLTTHEQLDVDMLVKILSQIRYEAGDKLDNETWQKINPLIQDALDKIPYLNKVSTIESYGDVTQELKDALVKVNTYRIEFAHPRSDILIQKYNIKSTSGKIKIRDLARALKKASDLFLKHSEESKACLYYVKKQLEEQKGD